VEAPTDARVRAFEASRGDLAPRRGAGPGGGRPPARADIRHRRGVDAAAPDDRHGAWPCVAAGRRPRDADVRRRGGCRPSLFGGCRPRGCWKDLPGRRLRRHVARPAGVMCARGKCRSRHRRLALRLCIPASADDRDHGCPRRTRVAGRLRGGRDGKAAPGRRLVFTPGAHLVAIGGQLRAGDAADGRVALRPARSRACARTGGYFTAKQVTVLKTPSIFWILSTINEPIELTSGASHTAMTSYSPVIASAAVIPLVPSIFLATSRARPGDALIRT